MEKVKELQNKISEIIKEANFGPDKLYDKGHSLQTSDTIFCFEDIIRNKAFYAAIEKAIADLGRDDIVVVDAGSGTGILGIYALSLGAKKCIFIENNPHSLELNKLIVEKLAYTDKSEFIFDDASKVELKEKPDIIISETIEASFLKEDFAKIIKNLLKFAKEDTIVIPEGFNLRLEYSEGKVLKEINLETKKDFENFDTVIIEKHAGVDVSGTVRFYKDVEIKSGDCMSFFNKKKI